MFCITGKKFCFKFRAIGWNSACEDFIIAKSLGAELPKFVLNRLDDVGCN